MHPFIYGTGYLEPSLSPRSHVANRAVVGVLPRTGEDEKEIGQRDVRGDGSDGKPLLRPVVLRDA